MIRREIKEEIVMRIESSTVAMVSQHDLVEKDIQQESLRVWDNTSANGGSPGNVLEEFLNRAKQDIVTISEQGKALFASKTQSAREIDRSPYELSEGDKQKLRLVQAMLEALTGKRVRFYLLDPDADQVRRTLDSKLKLSAMPLQIRPVNAAAPLLGWGMEYHSYQAHSEQESMSFQTAGIVKTADGKEINFSAQLTMSRQFISEQRLDIKAGDALRDPLVINFDSNAAQLTANKFQFDIDSDGTSEEMSFVKPGSGFLALDLNHDNVINNGNELFGTSSGNGFADLAKYDSDGNQWIDENDPIYQSLRIWTKDAEGQDQLLALGQKGIGAIYLGNVKTEFALKDNTNELLGQIRQTGIFLKEDGQVGTVQHVDLVI